MQLKSLVLSCPGEGGSRPFLVDDIYIYLHSKSLAIRKIDLKTLDQVRRVLLSRISETVSGRVRLGGRV